MRMPHLGDVAAHLEEFVNHARMADEGRLVAGRAQLLSIRRALVRQRVVLGRRDPRRRDIGERRRVARTVQRRETPVVAIGRVTQILREEPLDRVAGQQIAVREPRMRIGLLVPGRARIDQQLQRERHAPVAREHRADGGQRAARAVAADREPRRIDAEFDGMRVQPDERIFRIVHRGREPMLGREPVIDRQYRAMRIAGEHPAERVVRRHAADRETAAVIVDERRQRLGETRCDGQVETGAERRAVARGHVEILDRKHRRGGDLEDQRAALIGRAGLLGRQVVVGATLRALDHVEHLGNLRIQGHRENAAPDAPPGAGDKRRMMPRSRQVNATSCLPKLRPLSRPISVSGARSSPCAIVSR